MPEYGVRRNTDIYLRELILSSAGLAGMLATENGMHRVYPGIPPQDEDGKVEMPVIAYIRNAEVRAPADTLNSTVGPDVIVYRLDVIGENYDAVCDVEDLLMPLLEGDSQVDIIGGGTDNPSDEDWQRNWEIAVEVQDAV